MAGWRASAMAAFVCAALGGETLRVEVRDRKTGSSVPARGYVFAADGSFHLPPGATEYNKHQERHFVFDSSFQIDLPPGKYTVRVERGLEYRPFETVAAVLPGRGANVRVRLDRWISMDSRGWYSGDLHNHRKLPDMPLLMRAEDLNFATTLTDWIWEGRSLSNPPKAARHVETIDGRHAFSVLDKEVERLMHGPGAVDLVGLRTPIPFEGDWLYPPSDVFCKMAHEQGAYVDAEKILWRDAPALIALGHVDFAGIVHNHFNRHSVDIDVAGWGMAPKHKPEFDSARGMALWTSEIYHHLLNCGFKLPASAGSASGVKASPIGYNRVYVKLDRPFSYDEWLRALKQGRSFATNGPIVEFTVAGRIPGDTVALPAPSRIRVRVRAQSIAPLEIVEVFYRGRAIKSAEAGANQTRLDLDFEAQIDQPGWLAARCFERSEKTVKFAHTSPVYVTVGGRAGVDPESARFFVQWMDRETAFYRNEKRFAKPAHQQAMIAFFQQAKDVFVKLLPPAGGASRVD